MAPKKKATRALIPTKARALSAKEFLDLADVPPEIEWFANITNPQTRRAYQNDLKDFMRFTRISNPEVFRVVTRVSLSELCGPDDQRFMAFVLTNGQENHHIFDFLRDGRI